MAKESMANKIDLQSILENMDEKSRRKLIYQVNDFKLQRGNSLKEVEERKQYYFNLINAYYDKIPKITPRRYLNMTCGNFELENAYLTIDYMKFIDRPVAFAASVLKKNVLKYGGTPAKFKVTYSATKRKSIAKSEIKHFEFKHVSSNGQKTIIVATNKRSTGARSSGKRNLAGAVQTDSSVDEDEQKMKQAMQEYQLVKFREGNRHRHADIDSKQLKELAPQFDCYIDQVLASLTPAQENGLLSEEAQRALINDLNLNYMI